MSSPLEKTEIKNRVFIINEHDVKNNKTDLPEEVRDKYSSKSEYYIHSLITKFNKQLSDIEIKQPELCANNYKDIAKLIGSLESLLSMNQLLQQTFGMDLDITDYCESIDKSFNKI